MKPVLYIHLGQQKTGTTSLQRFCTRNRRELARRFGIIYPTPFGNTFPRFAHRHVSLFPYTEEVWRQVRREIDESGCRKVLLSNEDLSMTAIDDATLAGIRKTLPEFAIFYILYIRRIDDACRLWYMQSAKRDNMTAMTYDMYVADRDEERSYRLYPSGLLEQCVRQVGRENCIIRLYDREHLLNGNTVDDVFSLLGVTLPDDLDRSKQYNEGIPEEALPLLTDTLRLYKLPDPTRKEIYRKLTAAFRERPETRLPPHIKSEVEKEIERVDAYLPGYKRLYAEEKLSMDFPQSRISPQETLIIDLLYTILFELRKNRTRKFLFLRFCERHLLPLVKTAGSVALGIWRRLRRISR